MTIDEFLTYEKENPYVYELFDKYTRQALKSGRKYFSARAIWERMRWQSMIEDSSEQFKISDHPMPFYARLFEIRNPMYKGFFRKHNCPADKLAFALNKQELF